MSPSHLAASCSNCLSFSASGEQSLLASSGGLLSCLLDTLGNNTRKETAEDNSGGLIRSDGGRPSVPSHEPGNSTKHLLSPIVVG